MTSTEQAIGHSVEKAAEWLHEADSLIICAGAGMGVDSGLPDFRGAEGFWRAYPALRQSGLDFYDMANPVHFARQPELAWGFYGHRLGLYRQTVPHDGFGILQTLAEHTQHGAFVFTSNVDGQFQKAGFATHRVLECHGSIHHLQCSTPCSDAIWSANDFMPQVDENACRLQNSVPRCPACGVIARPNILMFGDGQWVQDRTAEQQAVFAAWLQQIECPLVIEIGAGTAVATVRQVAESLRTRYRARMLRINPDGKSVLEENFLCISAGGLVALGLLENEFLPKN